MGDRTAKESPDGDSRRAFTQRLIDDLRALDLMIANEVIERGARRIGAEQEMFLVDAAWRPAPASLRILERLGDPSFTIELGLFNLEYNTRPRTLGGRCFSELETEIDEALGCARRAAAEEGVEIVLAGILPTIRKSDLDLENMTPVPRFDALNRAIRELRGGPWELFIKGLDELLLTHDSVMLEACTTSFQVHLQCGPREFADLYNLAQLVAAPVLAAAANSPLLFGRQLWSETRIALFQQAVDTRGSLHFMRERAPRVVFGSQWVERSVIEIFHEDVARFRALVISDEPADSLELLRRGEIPPLDALRLFNGTVYRWNRPCYGVTDGRPHLRIENRVLPAGPSVIDQVANAALWIGLLRGFGEEAGDLRRRMPFEHAKINFTNAARHGLGAQLAWLDGETLPSDRLILDRLLPVARRGLDACAVDPEDAGRYLGVIERRVAAHRNGARWAVGSLESMRGRGTVGERMVALTAATAARQREGRPVAEWEPARLDESGGWKKAPLKVEQYMTADLYTVSEDEPIALVAHIMAWKRVRHVPVEDREHRLVGLVSYRTLLELVAREGALPTDRRRPVSDIMRRDPVVISPDASILEAIALMREHRIAALPVVRDDRLMGIITERDFMSMAAELLEEQCRRFGD